MTGEQRRQIKKIFYIVVAVLVVTIIVLCIVLGIKKMGNNKDKAGDETQTEEVTQTAETTEVTTEVTTEATTEATTEEAENDDWMLYLVNKDNPIQDYMKDIELTTLSNNVKVDSRIYPDLQEMFDAMRAENIFPAVWEGYRTNEEQTQMMQSKIDTFIAAGNTPGDAERMAMEWVAVPGTSEHELGIALDINAQEGGGSGHEQVYQWLAANAYKYGFILRYPEGKEAITGIDYEPWHYRYVGKEAAKEIFESGLVLEEYLDQQ